MVLWYEIWIHAHIFFHTGPGELKLGLDVNRITGMSLYRPAQEDLTVSLADNLIRPEMPDQVSQFLQKAAAKPMVRRFEFASMQGMSFFVWLMVGFADDVC
jgi:hypothetical protein